MRTKLRSKVTLLFIVCAVLIAVPGTAALAQDTGTSPAPTIQSDKDDYAPGELVTLTGSGWQAGESVNIVVNDDAGQTWNRNVNVTADASGNISDSFNLPGWFVATYNVTATGAQSGVATTSFTDGSIDVRAQAGTTNLAVTFDAGSVDRFNNLTCTGTSPNQTNASAFTTLTNGSYLASTVSANNNQSATIDAPDTVVDSGTPYNFKDLTTATGGVSIDSSTGCITRSGAMNPPWQMTANYVEAPKVNSINQAAASPTNASSVSWTVIFSKSVTGVDAGDFALANTGLTGPGSINVTGSGDTYTVTANTGTGDGTLGLNLVDNNTIEAGPNNPLGGTNAADPGNGSFTGQVYTIDKTAPTVTIVSTNPDTLEETGSSTITWNANETGSYSVRIGGNDCATATQVPSGSGTNLSGNYTTADTNVESTVDAAALAEGSNTIRICVTDAATNVGSATTTIIKNLIRQTTTTLTQTAGTNPSTYGEPVTFTATVTASAGNPNSVGTVDFKDGSTVICDNVALSGNTATCSPSLNAGSYSLTAEYSGTSSGSPKFSASTSSPALSHTVEKKELTVTAANKTITYGDPEPSFNFTYSGFVGTEGAGVIDTAPTCGVAGAHSDAGSYTITCSGGVDNNYSFKYVNGTLTVDQKELTVTANNQTKILGASDPSFTFTYNGFVNNENSSVINTEPTCGVSVTHTDVGSYPIVCSGGSDNNYKFKYVDGTLKIIFKFDGFRQPVDNNGVFNSAKAGQSIPIKFSLFGNQGLSILQPSTTLLPNPKVTSVTCPGASVTVDPIEEYATTTANNGLTYDATADQYNYVWKTQSTYANKCFKFDMVLIDGTHHEAFFQFKK